MIDISHKQPTKRTATAVSTILFSQPHTYGALMASANKKGDAIAVARIAAIQAAKQTANLIPLAHPSLNITGISINIDPFEAYQKTLGLRTHSSSSPDPGQRAGHGGVTITSTVSCEGKTGVEMEALMSASVGALTLYDMLKGVDKAMVITNGRVVRKEGGKSGGWKWDDSRHELVKLTGPQSHDRPLLSSVKHDANEKSTSTLAGVEGYPKSTSEVEEWNRGLANEFSVASELEDDFYRDHERARRDVDGRDHPEIKS